MFMMSESRTGLCACRVYSLYVEPIRIACFRNKLTGMDLESNKNPDPLGSDFYLTM